MEQFTDLYHKWRKKLNNAALMVAIITLLIEIIVSFFLYYSNLIYVSMPYYILAYIVLPSVSNFLLVLLGRYILNSRIISETAKNYLSVLILTAQFFIIACVHHVFIFTIVLFTFPILLTVIYSSKMMTNIVTLISLVFMLISSWIAGGNARTNGTFYAIELLIAVLLILGCAVITGFLTSIERDKNNIIKYSSFKQLQLEELIKCDPLTGLYNIASFYSTLDTLIKENQMPLTLAVIDVDNFKAVNDAIGHEKANQILIYIAAQLQYCCSTQGSVFRYGGEEFTIVFPKTSPAHAKRIIETAQSNILNHEFDENKKIQITFSCGIAAYPSADYNAHDFFQLADKIMYQAKFSGKNKVLIGTPSSISI